MQYMARFGTAGLGLIAVALALAGCSHAASPSTPATIKAALTSAPGGYTASEKQKIALNDQNDAAMSAQMEREAAGGKAPTNVNTAKP